MNERMDIELLIGKIRRDKGLDLSGYKESTLTRRIERRIKFDGASSLEEYIQMIDRDYHLYWRLISDFFIGVTDFFRDSEIWEIVREQVLPQVISSKLSVISRKNSFKNDAKLTTYNLQLTTNLSPILRLWSAGCSTGEETYSLAIAVKEALRTTLHSSRTTLHEPPVFIYGTDIMEDKLEIAKEGIYSEDKLKDMDGNIKFRYFQRSPLVSCESLPASRATLHNIRFTGYEILSEIRRTTRFRKYDLARPEALAGFDMVVCRNVLIYFQRELQEKALKNFHRALREGGILWLGTAESLSGETAKLFKPIYKKEKIFRKM